MIYVSCMYDCVFLILLSCVLPCTDFIILKIYSMMYKKPSMLDKADMTKAFQNNVMITFLSSV